MQKKAGTPRDVSQVFGIPLGTLANLRWMRKGPRFYYQGRRVVYFFADVESWLRRSPVLTSDFLEERTDEPG